MRTATTQQNLSYARVQVDKWQGVAGFAFTEWGRARARLKADRWAARVRELEQEKTEGTESRA